MWQLSTAFIKCTFVMKESSDFTVEVTFAFFSYSLLFYMFSLVITYLPFTNISFLLYRFQKYLN